MLVKVIAEADREEKPRVAVEQHMPGVDSHHLFSSAFRLSRPRINRVKPYCLVEDDAGVRTGIGPFSRSWPQQKLNAGRPSPQDCDATPRLSLPW